MVVGALLIVGGLYSSRANHASCTFALRRLCAQDDEPGIVRTTTGGRPKAAPPDVARQSRPAGLAQRRGELPLERREDLGTHAEDVLLAQRALR